LIGASLFRLYFDKREHEGRLLHNWSLESCDFVEKDAYWMDQQRQASKRQARLHCNRNPEHLSWILPFSFQCAIPSRDMPYATSLCQSDPTLYHIFPSANSDLSNAAILNLPTAMHDLADLLDLERPCEDCLVTSLSHGLGLTRMFMNRFPGVS
jgi:hypothetical protein